jgi:hypothetical protein
MRLDIWIGVVSILMTIIGAIISTWPPQTKRAKGLYCGIFVFLGGFSVVLIILQSNQVEAQQKSIQDKSDLREKELRGKLDQSLLSQEYMRGQLDSIGFMVGRLGQNNSSPGMRALAEAIKKMSVSANANPPQVIMVKSLAPGPFQIEHNLSCVPGNAVVQSTSPGIISWESPTRMFDDKKLYISASDADLTAQVLVWCKP